MRPKIRCDGESWKFLQNEVELNGTLVPKHSLRYLIWHSIWHAQTLHRRFKQAVSVLVRIPRCGGEQLKQLRRVPSIDLCIGPTIVLLLPEEARVCLQWNWKQQGDDWRPCIQKKPRKWRRRGSNSLCFDPFRHEIDSVGTAIVIEIDRRPGPYIPSFGVGCRRKAHARHVSAAITLFVLCGCLRP